MLVGVCKLPLLLRCEAGPPPIFALAALHWKDICSLISLCGSSSPHAGQGTTIRAILAWHCGRWIFMLCAKSALPHDGHGCDGGGMAGER